MAMPQRDGTIEAIKRLDALLEYAVMHGEEEEAERLRREKRENSFWNKLFRGVKKFGEDMIKDEE